MVDFIKQNYKSMTGASIFERQEFYQHHDGKPTIDPKMSLSEAVFAETFIVLSINKPFDVLI